MEGVVCKSNPLMLDRMGRRIIFKLKDEDYRKLEARTKDDKVEAPAGVAEMMELHGLEYPEPSTASGTTKETDDENVK
jgi:hypothetical protein